MHMLGILLMRGLWRLLIAAWAMLGFLAEPSGPQVQVRTPLLCSAIMCNLRMISQVCQA